LTTYYLAVQNNIMEIRTDALKLLAILRRPVPRAAATVGAWLNIFQVFVYLHWDLEDTCQLFWTIHLIWIMN